MKRLILLFVGLFLVSCDSGTTQAEGTSSETQSSLQALATRLDGLRSLLPAARPNAFAGRSAASASASDSSTWEDIWAEWSGVAYMKRIGQHPIVLARSSRNTFTSATSYQNAYTQTLTNKFAQSFFRSLYSYQSCSEPSEPPPYCVAGVPGHPQLQWMFTTFRNGVTISLEDSLPSPTEGYVIDGRWTIRENLGVSDPDNLWWDVFEKGRLIGRARQVGKSFIMGLDENSYLNALSTMTIFDLEGRVMLPKGSGTQEPVRFAEDSLGLHIDSAWIDTGANEMGLSLSWRFAPGPGLPLDGHAMFRIDVYDSAAIGTSEAWVSFPQVNPIRTLSGTRVVAIPLDSLRGRDMTTLDVSVSSRIDSLVGTRAQTRHEFQANCETAFPSWP